MQGDQAGTRAGVPAFFGVLVLPRKEAGAGRRKELGAAALLWKWILEVLSCISKL